MQPFLDVSPHTPHCTRVHQPRRITPLCAKEASATQEPMDQVVAQGYELVYYNTGQGDLPHESLSQVLTMWSQKCGTMPLQMQKYPRDYYCSIPIMTTMWASGTSKSLPGGKQFDSDSQALMLDDGISACITNDKDDFIETQRNLIARSGASKDMQKSLTEALSNGMSRMTVDWCTLWS